MDWKFVIAPAKNADGGLGCNSAGVCEAIALWPTRVLRVGRGVGMLGLVVSRKVNREKNGANLVWRTWKTFRGMVQGQGMKWGSLSPLSGEGRHGIVVGLVFANFCMLREWAIRNSTAFRIKMGWTCLCFNFCITHSQPSLALFQPSLQSARLGYGCWKVETVVILVFFSYQGYWYGKIVTWEFVSLWKGGMSWTMGIVLVVEDTVMLCVMLVVIKSHVLSLRVGLLMNN